MGGFGSGRWLRWDSKETTESQRRVDIRYLRREGYLECGSSGELAWKYRGEHSGSICFEVKAGLMILTYRYSHNGDEWDSIEQCISLDRTPCNFGGYRIWFRCPRCAKRIEILYGAGKYFYCRHCYCLNYASQHEGRLDRLMRKIAKIRERLGVSDSYSMPILYKPKNMHYKTFQRMKREADDADRLYWTIVNRMVGIEQTRENNSLGRR